MAESKTDKAINGMSVQTIIIIVMGIMELVVFSIMSRLLTKDDFGYFAALTGIMTIYTSITEAGLGSAIIQKKDAQQAFVSTAFTLSWLLGIIGTVILFISAPIMSEIIADEHLTLPLRIMSINIFLSCIASVGRSMLIRNLKFKKNGMFEIIAYAMSSIIGLSLAFLGFGLYAIVSISVCNLIILNIFLYTRGNVIPKLGIRKSEVPGIVSYGGWLTLSVITNNIAQMMDRLFLPKWLSVTALGAYNRPAGFVSTIIGKINGIFDTVLFPMLSGIQDDSEKVQAVFIRAIALLNSFAAVLFAIFFFNADLIINIFFGSEWLDLVPVLRVISIFIIFNVDNRLVDCFFRSLGLVNLGFRLRLVSAVITFLFLFIGCKFGIMGVAISILIANIVTVCLKVFFLSKKVNVNMEVVLANFITAEKPLLLLCVIGVPYLMLTHTIVTEICFAIIMGIIIVAEFIFFPQMVGKEYTNTIHPKIEKIVSKLIFKFNK